MKKYINRIEERNLIREYQLYKDSDVYSEQQIAANALEKLLEAHTAYVLKIANQEHQKCGKVVEYEDLVQEGKIGLIKAINKFKLDLESINPNDNTVVTNQALLTYAHSYIRSEMQTLFHRSNAAHIPAHTIRAIQFDVKNPGCNTEERKSLAKKAMRAESLSDFTHENSSNERKIKIPVELINADPTFNDSVKHIYSPENMKAIEMLSPEEWEIIQLRYGLVGGEEGMVAKSPYIAKALDMPIEKVEKIFKRAKRILSKNLVNYK